MTHTIVVEVPDFADAAMAETRITQAIERVSWSDPTYTRRGHIRNIMAKVVEYHHERMTSS
jgi:hypothetical protein